MAYGPQTWSWYQHRRPRDNSRFSPGGVLQTLRWCLENWARWKVGSGHIQIQADEMASSLSAFHHQWCAYPAVSLQHLHVVSRLRHVRNRSESECQRQLITLTYRRISSMPKASLHRKMMQRLCSGQQSSAALRCCGTQSLRQSLLFETLLSI